MRAPVLAIGDGALGFWKAVREVFPETKVQRRWFHVGGNVLAALPKSAHPGAKAALAEIYSAQDRGHAVVAARAFEDLYGAKWPKAAAKITEHLDVLLAFYDFPAEHWIHLRTTNPIESTFATVRLRQRVTTGPGSRPTGDQPRSRAMTDTNIRLAAVVLDCPDTQALTAFYASLLAGKVAASSDETWAELEPPHQLLHFQRVDDYIPPSWPDGGPQQFHLDTWSWTTSSRRMPRWSRQGRHHSTPSTHLPVITPATAGCTPTRPVTRSVSVEERRRCLSEPTARGGPGTPQGCARW